jgi:hypothetical protein
MNDDGSCALSPFVALDPLPDQTSQIHQLWRVISLLSLVRHLGRRDCISEANDYHVAEEDLLS